MPQIEYLLNYFKKNNSAAQNLRQRLLYLLLEITLHMMIRINEVLSTCSKSVSKIEERTYFDFKIKSVRPFYQYCKKEQERLCTNVKATQCIPV